jgi:hypothetical protein
VTLYGAGSTVQESSREELEMIGSEGTAADPKAPKGESSMSKSSPPTSEPSANADLLSITVNSKTGQIVKVESVDDAGVRRDLSDEKRASLAKERGKDTLEALLERAFEAGIACVLGGTTAEDNGLDEEEAELRHMLLRPLIRHSAAERLMQRDILARATLGTVIRNTIKPSSEDAAPSGPARKRPRGAASG